MKNLSLLFKALVDGKTLKNVGNRMKSGEMQRLDADGNLQVSYDEGKTWAKSAARFMYPADWIEHN